jgi:chaperone modulatory protein CbpM
MIDTAEFLVHARLDAHVLEAWIEYGWLVPRREPDMREFSEIDLARVQLIRDLKEDMGVNDEGVAVVLDLIDQIHGLRRTLRGLVSALSAQPEELRRQIVADAARATGADG